MNPVDGVVSDFQDLVAEVPDVLQPLVVLLAGAVPFVEGEGASAIGVAGGIPPVVAGLAAALGNFLCVLVVVTVSSRARTAVVELRANRSAAAEGATVLTADEPTAKPESKGRLRFRRWLARFGVPGASILGPLAIPTHFTSAMLVAAGVPRSRVLLWQGVAIVFWTTVTTVSMTLALRFVLT